MHRYYVVGRVFKLCQSQRISTFTTSLNTEIKPRHVLNKLINEGKPSACSRLVALTVDFFFLAHFVVVEPCYNVKLTAVGVLCNAVYL